MVEEAFLVGRILFAFLLIGSGVGHLTATAAMAGYAESKGLKNGALMVQISGVALIAGGVAIVLGIWGDLASLGVAILMIAFAVIMHPFWKETDAQAKQMEMIQFNKDIALAGAALITYALFYSVDGFGFYTLTGAVFN